MSEMDSTYIIARMMQCVWCKNDPETCGCTDDDEDENGFCRQWAERKEE